MLLTVSGNVTLSGSGGGTIVLGPGQNGDRGPAMWSVTGVVLKSNRPGEAPIPRATLYRNLIADANVEGNSYDASFDQGAATDLILRRGETLIAVITGGQNGDVVTLALSGTRQ